MMCTENDRLTTYGRYKYAMQYYACVKYINGTNEGGINDEQWREWGFDIHWSGFTG